MKKNMCDTLDKYLAKMTVNDSDRNSYQICNLNDKENKLTICLVFLRDWDSLEPNAYNALAINPNGAVITFPSYWLSVPKELAIPYFDLILQEVYKDNNWNYEDSSSGSGTINPGTNPGGNNNCCCGNMNGGNGYTGQTAYRNGSITPCGVV